MNTAFLNVLQRNGYIRGYRNPKDDLMQNVEVLLKYREGKPAINTITQISKPSGNIYLPVRKLFGGKGMSQKKTSKKGGKLKFDSHLLTQHKDITETTDGTFVLSTPKGLLSHSEAYKANTGGQVLCHIS